MPLIPIFQRGGSEDDGVFRKVAVHFFVKSDEPEGYKLPKTGFQCSAIFQIAFPNNMPSDSTKLHSSGILVTLSLSLGILQKKDN
jgi:hypothetical protein